MAAGLSVDELCTYAHLIAGPTHRAFEQIPNPSLSADLRYIECLALVLEQ